MNKKIIWPVLYMIVIFILSSIPMDGGSGDVAFLTDLDPTLQNLLHIPLYGFLSLLWVIFFFSTGWPWGRTVILTIAVTIGFGCLDEFHQSFVPGRYGGLMDVLLNSFGAIAGIIFFRIFNKNILSK